MKTLLTLIAITLSLTTMAQDILIDTEGNPVKCKIASITDTEVIYRNADKTLNSMPKELVLMIQYGDGKKEFFNGNAPVETVKQAEVKTVEKKVEQIEKAKVQTQEGKPAVAGSADKIKIDGKKYYINGNRIKESVIVELIKKSDCVEAKAFVKKRHGGSILNIMGAGIMGGAVGVGVYTYMQGDEQIPVVAAGGVAVGLTMLLVGNAVMNKQLRKAVEAYNKCNG